MGHEFQVRMVGAFASREEERRLRNRALRLGIDRFVEYAEVLTGAEKHSAYADAEIFCYPTHHESETFGLSVVEAMSFGLPVVATRWRGLAEIVVDGRTGHLVPVRDPTSLATKLRDLLLDSEKRARMGEEGRNRYCQQYSLEQFHRAFKTLFLEQVDHLDNGDR